MKTIPDLMKEFAASSGHLIVGLEQIPKDDPRFIDIFEYKCKIQNLLVEWEGLLKKWSDDENWWTLEKIN